VRVAFTLEQCWHRVPGGTARAALEVAAELARGEGAGADPAAAGGADVEPAVAGGPSGAGRVARGAEVELVGVSAWHRRPPEPDFRPPVPVRAVPLPRRALYESWHRLRRPAVERATGSVDLIHATGVAVPPRSVPLVVTVHDLAFVHEPGNFTRWGVRFFGQALALTIAQADLVICPSEATAADCRRAGFDAERLVVIPLGVRARPVPPEEVEAARRRFGLARPFVLWTGTVEPRKNLPVVIESFRRLARPDLDLVLVGPAGWHTDLGHLLRPVADRTRVLGFLPRRQLDAVYAAAEMFCYPSLLEGFGLPVAEAMAQGTPVVTSRGTSTEEVAGGAGLVVDPRDPSAVAEALAAVLDDGPFARRLAEAGRARAAELTWARTAQRTVEAYRRVLS
jgi:glycosyltransferase involved in cell wall biosynthesis